ncbi:MAG: DUF6489 family protein [Sphingopyxis sp.]
MKIKITLDVTPLEARATLGLPDVSSLHDIYLERMRKLVEDGVTPELVGTIVKSWSSIGDAGIGMAQQLFGQIGSSLTGGLGGAGKGSTTRTTKS